MTTTGRFTREMNRHRYTSYKCVNQKYVLEYGHGPLTDTDHVSVWRHVEDGEADESAGEIGYPHDWVKVAATGFIDPSEAQRRYHGLTSETAILEFRDSDANANDPR